MDILSNIFNSFLWFKSKKAQLNIRWLELNAFISRSESLIGHRTITIYKPTQKGIVFCNKIIVPYEKVFPRDKRQLSEIYKGTVESGDGQVRENKNKSHKIITTIS